MKNNGELKPFQTETVDAVVKKFSEKKKKRILVADEVGMGKTKVAKGIIHELSDIKRKQSDKPYRVLYMAPSSAIISENIEKLLDSEEDKGNYKTVHVEGDRFIELFRNNENISSAEDRDIEIYSMSPGILFETHSPFGTVSERNIIYSVIQKCIESGNSNTEALKLTGIFLEKGLKVFFEKEKIIHGYSDKTTSQVKCDGGLKTPEACEIEYICKNITDAVKSIIGEFYYGFYDIIELYSKKCQDNGKNFYEFLFENFDNNFSKWHKDKAENIDNVASDFVSLIKLAVTLGFPVKKINENTLNSLQNNFPQAEITFTKLDAMIKEKLEYIYEETDWLPDMIDLFFYREFCRSMFSGIRNTVSMAKYHTLSVDLIIADEFHRYFGHKETAVIEELLGLNDSCRLLLLSATPYRMNELKVQHDKESYYNAVTAEDREKDPGERRYSEPEEAFDTFGDILYYLGNGKVADKNISGDNIKRRYDNDMDKIRGCIKELSAIAGEEDNKDGFDEKWKELKEIVSGLEKVIYRYVVRTERFRVFDVENDSSVRCFGTFLDSNNGIKDFQERYLEKEMAFYTALKRNINHAETALFPLSFCKDYKSWGAEKEVTDNKYKYKINLSSYTENGETADTLKNAGALWDGSSYIYGSNMRMDCLIHFINGSVDEYDSSSDNMQLPPDDIGALSAMGKLLWLPPLYPKTGNLGGCFKEFKEADHDPSKVLVFCHYRMTAASIAALLSSYEPVSGMDDGMSEGLKNAVEAFNGTHFFEEAWESLGCELNDEINESFGELNKAFKVYFKNNAAVLARAGVDDGMKLEKYCENGCLSDVLAEWFFVKNVRTAEDVRGLTSVLSYDRAVVKYFSSKNKPSDDYLELDENDMIRCRFAEIYTDDRSDSGDSKPETAEQISAAFNSPFYPFVLAATGRAQEGIDLHYYCDRIMHWDLVIDPVVFEQREGRINRRLCYLVRKRAVEQWGGRGLTWNRLFKADDERQLAKDCMGFYPEWYIPPAGNEEHFLKRLTVNHPLNSREMLTYKYLKLTLGLYRISLGLDVNMEWIQNILKRISADNSYDMYDIMINLSPPFRPKRIE